ncbi:MAG TPA: thioredoxin domain-containing protein [Nitrospirota bacterium]|nr:thioredoxin domain-containing protein [Nitrospirota bacterium]
MKYTNRLIHEKSPYLLQHAHNPVDWFPWGPEAFEKARKENKPIFLSIGYSTCHWCHVMESESFDDPEVARLMNEVFVCIKVDREERPDIDQAYMRVCQMMNTSCGWPLNILMTSGKKPFFAGTYFPRESRFGTIGLLELTARIKALWKEQREKLFSSADEISEALRQSSHETAGAELGEADLKAAFNQLVQRFDKERGGFGPAPKFPTPQNILFLFRYWKRTGDTVALEMAEKTLRAMRNGGIYDHLGFGFHRYSTDSEWLVPHFEKMLYDQAMLAMAYTEAYQATGKEEYKKTAKEIFAYVLRDMSAPEGGFYSAEDADSEGEEGKFYLWTEEQLYQILGKKEADFVIQVYHLEKGGNFTEKGQGPTRKTGRNILHLMMEPGRTAASLKISEKELGQRLEAARGKLYVTREKRIHPHKDDKVLTDWNGLMIAALAKGAQVFDDPGYADEAKHAADFILKHMRRTDGRLLHRFRDGQAAISAYGDDYAFLIWGLIELYETTFDVSYLQAALDLNSIFLKRFWDNKQGGFYFTADDGEDLFIRSKEIYDGAIPSCNSVAMSNLLRLARMTADPNLEKDASHLARAFSVQVRQNPSAYTQLMATVDFGLGPSYEVVIVGDQLAEDTKAMVKALRKIYMPNKVVLLRPIHLANQKSIDITHIAGFTLSQSSIDGKATAYVCLNFRCQLPTTDINKMNELLNEK